MVRRWLGWIGLLGLCIGCICGCAHGGKTAQDPVTTGFSCDTAISYQDLSIEGHLTRKSAGMLELEFKQPSTLQGVVMEWDGENLNMKMGGLSFGVDPSILPDGALGQELLQALDAGFRAEEGGEVTEEGVHTSGTTVSGSFELISDPETGRLLSLSFPEQGLKATFSNFQLIGE